MRLWPRRRRICHARSPMPMGLWCMRFDRHRDDEHEATFSPDGLTLHDLPPEAFMRDGRIVLRWSGDHPYNSVEAWAPTMETFTRLLWGARVATGATTPEDAERNIARAVAGFPRLVK